MKMKQPKFIELKRYEKIGVMIPWFRFILASIILIYLLILKTQMVIPTGLLLVMGGYVLYSLVLVIVLNKDTYLKHNVLKFFIITVDILFIDAQVIILEGDTGVVFLFLTVPVIISSLEAEFKVSFPVTLLTAVIWFFTLFYTNGLSIWLYVFYVIYLFSINIFCARFTRVDRAVSNKMIVKDGLTSLYNYIYFQDVLKDYLKRKNYDYLSLSFMDVDGFKKYNDRYGHQQGDRILSIISKAIKDNIRSTDIAARYGGDEFVILFPNANKKEAINICNRLKESIESAFGEREVTISIGVTSISSEADIDKDAFVRRADSALLKAKSEGKNRIVYY